MFDNFWYGFDHLFEDMCRDGMALSARTSHVFEGVHDLFDLEWFSWVREII